ncbi:PstS family phosphate ABC transporter substrate-binding protein [Flavobacterium sp.]|uniref:PstS family phosphate ABC transporter substrate-binding protein n=1 Tax=Flavobacterium sp. TaxID=239 RepID=UPI0008B5F48D|nr:substrate-binding domain-containing protein [Flavobacterium sp.]OGS64595.1 MAG: phosphate ABC transporter substrate-binding protein [Flavobacteria bacterium GWA2_35_26]HCF04063.1 phosphate ABC transporter substrate-binding protein [Flavobacterium sp.]
MNSTFKLIIAFCVLFLAISCNKSADATQETILKGNATLLVDATLMPVMEDQVQIFESRYEATIKMNAQSETEVIQSLVKDTSSIAVLSRKLNADEMKIFANRKIIPKITPIAIDAVALITNKNSNDTLVDIKDVIDFMNGKLSPKIKGLVFDNPNSSTVRYMNTLAGLTSIPQKGVFSFGTNNEVIKFVSQNEGMIGVVGLNWLTQPRPEMQPYVDKVTVLSVKGKNLNDFYAPDQNNIAEGKYPLARELYIVNCQGFSGLGMGFASFVAGDIGQRIILKSGLLPYKVPPRKLSIRNQISNDKK